nr:hypothetical protein [Tanacetum cinerariifolium]
MRQESFERNLNDWEWLCSASLGKGLLGPRGGNYGGNGGNFDGNGGRGGFIARRGGDLLGSERMHEGRWAELRKQAQWDPNLWLRFAWEILRDVIGESGGETFGVDGGAIWYSVGRDSVWYGGDAGRGLAKQQGQTLILA